MSEDRPRYQAFLLLDDIIQNKKFANLALKNKLDSFDKRDKAFITALVYGTLDMLINIDYVISLFAKGKIHSKVRNILRMGIYQILYMDKVPDSAAVSTSVDIAQRIGKGMIKGYINGVLRNVSRNKDSIEYPADKAKMLALKYSYPEFFVRELISDIGVSETEAFLNYESDHKTCLRVDESKASIEDVKVKLSAQDGIYFDNCIYVSGEPEMLEDGVCSVQSEASVAVVKALGLNNGDTLLDCCAAPGGKTVYAASVIKEGRIVAFDKYPHRVELITNNCKRCGYDNIVEARCVDMINDNFDGKFDKILVDAPCSGMGVLGQKPEIKNTITPEICAQIESTQYKILNNASKHLKKGGVLVYSTCTVRKRENIDIIKSFLRDNSDFSLCSLEGFFGYKFSENRDLEGGYIQLYPHKDKIEGFFIARMVKN